jgi:hypothetical protein
MLGDLNRRLYRSFFICELLWPAIEPWSRSLLLWRDFRSAEFVSPPRAKITRSCAASGQVPAARSSRGPRGPSRTARVGKSPENLQENSWQAACRLQACSRSAPKRARHGSRHLPADGRRLKPRPIRTGCPRYRQTRPAIRPVADFSNPIQGEIKCATPTQTN